MSEIKDAEVKSEQLSREKVLDNSDFEIEEERYINDKACVRHCAHNSLTCRTDNKSMLSINVYVHFVVIHLEIMNPFLIKMIYR